MIKLMAHMIPYYPNLELSTKIALGMLTEGIGFLEVQFPFSDPSADGPVIEAACQKSIQNGFTIDCGFEFLRNLRDNSPELSKGSAKLFVMTYASLIMSRGVESFVAEAAKCGVSGVIIPDLPLDSDEGLYEACSKHGIEVIPVFASSSRPSRIALMQEKKSEYVYCALRTGITGVTTELGESNIEFLNSVSKSGAKVLAGFGIVARNQVETLDTHAHAAVVGSAFFRALNSVLEAGGSENDAYKAVIALVRELMGK